jgi:methanogenic corrinoid protein MtbC1
MKFESERGILAPAGQLETFCEIILNGDRRGAERYACKVFDERGVFCLYDELIRPALEEVGRLWYTDRITVGDEHLATATAQVAVASLYSRFRWLSEGPPSLVAGPEGERHDFGGRMIADVLGLSGWTDRFLGGDVPTMDLAREAERLHPKLVALSVTLPMHLPAVSLAIARLRETTPDAKIIIGGAAVADLRDPSALGADAIAHCCSDAVEVVRAWK